MFADGPLKTTLQRWRGRYKANLVHINAEDDYIALTVDLLYFVQHESDSSPYCYQYKTVIYHLEGCSKLEFAMLFFGPDAMQEQLNELDTEIKRDLLDPTSPSGKKLYKLNFTGRSLPSSGILLYLRIFGLIKFLFGSEITGGKNPSICFVIA